MKKKYDVMQIITYDETETSKSGLNETKVKNPGIGVRHLQSLLLALCVFCGYLIRVNLSVTILAMTKPEEPTESKQDYGFPAYYWDEDVQGWLHASFFLGYLVMNFPAACLGVYFNLKMLLLISTIVNGMLDCMTPILINMDYNGTNEFLLQIKEILGEGNWRVFAVLRTMQGMIQAFMIPTIHAIIAQWAPPNERGRLVGFIMTGIPFGTMVALAGSGELTSNANLGWPSVFYISGVCSILWALFWGWFGFSSPSAHPTISSEEYNYICSELPPKSEKKVPWIDLFTSLPVWAIVIAHTTHNWGFWLLLSEMPTFLHAVSGFNIKSDGLLSSTPYVTMWLLQFPVMWVADTLNKRGLWGSAAGLLVLGHLDNNTLAAVSLYIVSVGIGCCCNVGFNVNHMDLTSNYAGIAMGLSNGIAATGGFGAPLMVSVLVQDITSVSQWRTVFYAGAGILFLGNLFFVLFGSGETQSWNNKHKDTRC
ncbi:sialin-like isoform X2 [Planococcus citri]|uniref:sialin-like isoform X2 n=1 Tax=Planococcus citri TaxID=170843 RepID=UPI0031F895F3